jgi:Fe-S-cluster-containing hydrogenase component 2
VGVKGLLVHKQLCSGCRACELACTAHHERCFALSLARLKIRKNESLGLDYPYTCRRCGRAPCIAACDAGALYRDSRDGVIRLRPEVCDGCGDCVQACTFGVVAIHPATGLALICDLCDGDPACVKRCATGALVYAEGRGAESSRAQLRR